jgi:para-aminobenzoate synthetase
MRTLIIDNYDSFTFNLFQMIATINGEEPIVVRNDQVEWRALEDQAYDNIVISPGPGGPERDEDFGICKQVILSARVPMLGVCLGHQGICHLFGGKIRHAPEPMHGRLGRVYHDGSELWNGIPQGVRMVRYHSLIADNALPDCLQRTAWTEDGIMMAMRHKTRPMWGVQFHPESICSEYGDQLLRNFRDLTHKHGHTRTVAASANMSFSVVPTARRAADVAPAGFRVRVRKLELAPDLEEAYRRLFEKEPLSFWLDSSRAEPGLARFSFMGGGSGPHASLVTYNASTREITEIQGSTVRRFQESIYTYLDRELRRHRCENADLPFDFNCGFVGYFGYELKVEAGATHRHKCDYPDAIFLLADRIIAFDHLEQTTYLLCLVTPLEDAAADAWFDKMESKLREDTAGEPPRSVLNKRPIAFRLGRPHGRYLDDIARCKRYIRDGESYEICLTNHIHTTAVPNPVVMYSTLRRVNPAPYSALLNLGDVVVLSSSPERFLRIDRDGWVESKPIKGTRPRGKTPEEDAALRSDLAENEKDRSENLMIVDLLRNDLGMVCEIGSVHVPKLMNVESYQTVHQLVSTIRGKLRPGLSAVDCVKYAFPGGSMTGAPKLRTMNIIDELEDEPRGVYSGAIGFLGFNGTADLNIVIRTIVETPAATTIGVGGAIVMLSDPDEEFEETMVKARALVHAIVLTSRGSVDETSYEAAMEQLRERGVATF